MSYTFHESTVPNLSGFMQTFRKGEYLYILYATLQASTLEQVFLGSVGTERWLCGLSECLQVVYGENAVTHIHSGKAVARALRAHFLIQNALILKVITTIIEEKIVGEEVLVAIKALYDSFINGEASDEEMRSKIVEKVHGAISRKMNILATTSRTAVVDHQFMTADSSTINRKCCTVPLPAKTFASDRVEKANECTIGSN